MTIDVVFMTMNKVVLRITMGVTNFYCKIIQELTTEGLEENAGSELGPLL